MGKVTKAQQAEAREYLLEYLKPGDRVYTILRHVSSSGMSRRISVVVMTDKGAPYCVDHLVARLGLFNRRGNHDGLVVNGAGMDMGFHLVYTLAYDLFGDGYALKQTWL